ncbi:MAG TPA: hypothetical protein DD713_05370 [Nitrospiraceae bacterium]|nr:hypothetical protein [Nitrospiraceae bacterium]
MVNDIEDVTIAAFLFLKGHEVTPYRRTDGHVVFEVSDNITRDVEALYANEKVGVLDYIKILKSLRSSIFALKSLRKRED